MGILYNANLDGSGASTLTAMFNCYYVWILQSVYRLLVYNTSSLIRRYQNWHQNTFKNSDEKNEAIIKAISSNKNSISKFVDTLRTKNKSNDCRYTIAQSTVDKSKPFSDAEFIKRTILFEKC